jgi:hypothetical protein
VLGCSGGSSEQRSADGAADVADVADAADAADTTDATDVTDVTDVHDVNAHDAIELDASVSCSSTTCGPGEVCVHENGVPDAGLEDNCYPVPSACAGVPTCACVSGLNASFRCGMSCSQIGEREFMCMGF